MGRSYFIFGGMAVVAGFGFSCLAQSAVQVARTGKVQFSASLRSRMEIWDWFSGEADNRYVFSGNLMRVGLSGRPGSWEWRLDLAGPVLLGLPDRAVGPGAQGQFGLGAAYYAANDERRNSGMAFVKQAYLRRDWAGNETRFSLLAGRFEWLQGSELTPQDPSLALLKRERANQRLIGPIGWTHVGRSFDGLRFSADRGRTNCTAMAAVATRGTFQVDGWGQLKTAVSLVSLTRAAGSDRAPGEWRLETIYYHDWRAALKADNRPLAVRRDDQASVRVVTLNGHGLWLLRNGAGVLDFLLWGAAQGGRWGRLDHRAYAIAGEAGWQPRLGGAWAPWVRTGWFRSSGDSDPGDRKHGTFHQLLPSTRLYARTPFYNMMNSEEIFGSLMLRPHRAVTLRSDFRALRLTEKRDLWYTGGGAFQPWTFGFGGRDARGARSLANLLDASVDWSVNGRLALGFYAGYVMGRAAVRAIFPEDATSTLTYIELNYRF